MNIAELSCKGLKLIKPKVFKDNRGFFLESYSKPLYYELGIDITFFQDNLVFSYKNAIRGMHFQTKPGQDKLVYVVNGEILDVAVDIRPTSPTFGRYNAEILNDRNHHQLFIPHGFAHGYCVLSQSAYVAYKVSNIYSPKAENGFRYNDPKVNINWPIIEPLISERDENSPFFDEVNFKAWF